MDIKEFCDQLFRRMDKGAQYEVYYQAGDSFSVKILDGEIDKYSVNNACGLSLRVKDGNKIGYASTTVFDAASIDGLIASAKSNLSVIENEEEQFFCSGGGTYPAVSVYNGSLDHIGAEEKIALARALERQTLARDSRVLRTQHCLLSTGSSAIGIRNSLGLELYQKSSFILSYVSPVVSVDGVINTSFAFSAGLDIKDIDIEKMARNSVTEAIALCGAQSVASGSYRTIFRHDAFCSLMETFSDIFSADAAQRGLSLLAGKENTAVASDCVTLIDDPLLKNGLCSSPFDAEGVPSYTKKVIENGRLLTLLHNMRTAAKANVASTGNASKSGYTAPIDISPSNFYIQPGPYSFDALLRQAGDGLVITDLAGLHSGANCSTGDFSLSAKGYVIKDGAIDRAVGNITVAGNIYKLLTDILAVGNDLDWDMPSSMQMGAPSVLIASLSIAGE